MELWVFLSIDIPSELTFQLLALNLGLTGAMLHYFNSIGVNYEILHQT